MPVIGIFLAVGVGLVIAALVVRDQTQFRLSRLRAQVVSLRNEERRVAEQRRKVDLEIAQVSEALMRGMDRLRDAKRACESFGTQLERLQAMPEEEGELGAQAEVGEEAERPPAREVSERKHDLFA